MPIIIDGHRRILGDVATEIDRLERLLIDLRHIQQSLLPGPIHFENAPLLEEWQVIPRPAPALSGFVDGHPRINDGRPVVTTLLTAFAPDLRWARTESRFYRLGRSHAHRRLQ